jgi:hemerythrin-like domain-containing protein
MTATEQLKAEHGAIKLVLRIIEKMCERLKSGDDVQPEHLEQVLEFLKVFADKCHHTKEEELLFPALEKIGVPREEGPIGVMLAEHNKARQYVKGMGEGIARYKAGGGRAAAKIVENGMAYIRILTAHIDKEDNVLYPIADARLPKSVQDELLARFDKVETQKIGDGKHEEFHRMLENLEKVYLGQ